MSKDGDRRNLNLGRIKVRKVWPLMIRRESKNDPAQFGLILELTSQNKDAVVKLQSGYCMTTATGNLIPVASGQSDGREQQGNMGCVSQQFTHFISVGTRT